MLSRNRTQILYCSIIGFFVLIFAPSAGASSFLSDEEMNTIFLEIMAHSNVHNQNNASKEEGFLQAEKCFKYAEGYKLEQNIEEALILCNKAIANGISGVHFYLGIKYQNFGSKLTPLSKDNKKAIDHIDAFLKANPDRVDVNIVRALAYQEGGYGIEKDEGKAFFYMEQAAQGENVLAQKKLSEYYSEGIGIEKNQAEAENWRKKAEENGKEKDNALPQP